MHQPPLALGGKPRRVDRPVAAVAFASAAASILGPRPTLRLRFATVTESVPLVCSWCSCVRWIVVHSTSRNRTPLLWGYCQDAHKGKEVEKGVAQVITQITIAIPRP